MDVRLAFEYVEPGGDDLALGERLGQGLVVDDRAARGIHQHGRGLDEGKAPGVDQMAGLRGEVGVEGDEVRLAEQIVQVPVLGLELLFRLGGGPVHVVPEDAQGEPARAGAGIWARSAVPAAARPVSAEPQSDVRRRGCWLATIRADVAHQQLCTRRPAPSRRADARGDLDEDPAPSVSGQRAGGWPEQGVRRRRLSWRKQRFRELADA